MSLLGLETPFTSVLFSSTLAPTLSEGIRGKARGHMAFSYQMQRGQEEPVQSGAEVLSPGSSGLDQKPVLGGGGQGLSTMKRKAQSAHGPKPPWRASLSQGASPGFLDF
jgi:hypothetical protein